MSSLKRNDCREGIEVFQGELDILRGGGMEEGRWRRSRDRVFLVRCEDGLL